MDLPPLRVVVDMEVAKLNPDRYGTKETTPDTTWSEEVFQFAYQFYKHLDLQAN